MDRFLIQIKDIDEQGQPIGEWLTVLQTDSKEWAGDTMQALINHLQLPAIRVYDAETDQPAFGRFAI